MAKEYCKVLNFLKIPINGIYSRTFKKAELLKKKFFIKNNFKNLDDMLKESDSTHVVIAVSEINTLKICKTISKYNLNLLIEKPCGYNFKQSKIINKFFKNKKNVYLALNRRFFNSTLKAKKLLKTSEKRQILVLDQQAPNKNRPKKIQDNWMYVNSIHLIDYIYNFCRGEIKKIITNKSIKGVKNVTIIFSSGDIATYKAFWNMPGPWGVMINTKKIYLKLMPLEFLEYRGMTKRSEKNNNVEIYDEKNFKPGLVRMTLMFLKNNNKSLMSLNYNLKLMELIRKIYF
jgi:predicted dehydrogenase